MEAHGEEELPGEREEHIPLTVTFLSVVVGRAGERRGGVKDIRSN